MGSNKHTGVGAASARTHYAQAAQVQDGAYSLAASVSGTNTITATLSPSISAYASGMRVVVIPANTNTDAVTLALNGITARAIVKFSSDALVAGDLIAGVPAVVIYDLANTQWVLQNPQIIPVANGGTGSTTASAARTALGVQAQSAALDAIAALTATDSNFIVGNGSTWVAESGSTARTSLGLGSLATASSVNDGNWSGTDLAVANGGTGASDASGARTNLGLAIGTNVQAYDADLAAIAALAKTDGNFIVGNGSTWVAESGSTVRTSLGLGSLATASSINNSNWSGTDLAVTNGGTGASDASTARSNLGLGSIATYPLTISTSAPSGGSDGDLWFVREA